MNNFDKYSEKTVLIWTCCWVIVAVALRLLTWRDPTWMPHSWSHYPSWLLALRSFAALAALGGMILQRWRRQ